MTTIITLIPAIPFLSFLILALFGHRLSRRIAGIIGAGSIGIIAVLTLIIAQCSLSVRCLRSNHIQSFSGNG